MATETPLTAATEQRLQAALASLLAILDKIGGYTTPEQQRALSEARELLAYVSEQPAPQCACAECSAVDNRL